MSGRLAAVCTGRARQVGVRRGRPLTSAIGKAPVGENLAGARIEVTGAVIGERRRVGTAELEVCQPRPPCAKLGYRFGDPGMVKAFARAGRPGAYLRVLLPGEVAAGDPVELLSAAAQHLHRACLPCDRGRRRPGRARRAAAELPPSLALWLRGRATA